MKRVKRSTSDCIFAAYLLQKKLIATVLFMFLPKPLKLSYQFQLNLNRILLNFQLKSQFAKVRFLLSFADQSTAIQANTHCDRIFSIYNCVLSAENEFGWGSYLAHSLSLVHQLLLIVKNVSILVISKPTDPLLRHRLRKHTLHLIPLLTGVYWLSGFGLLLKTTLYFWEHSTDCWFLLNKNKCTCISILWIA